MTRSNSLIYTLVLGGGALLFLLSACAAPNSAPTLAPTAPAPQTATPVPPTALAVRTDTKVLPTDLPTIAPTRTELLPTATREVFPTATPIPDVTRVVSPTITASQVISNTPQADSQTAALITAALQKTRALENYHGFIKFQIGQALVENWNGDLDGDVAQYTHFSDWFSEDVEILLKDGKHYERPYSGGEYGVWREIPQAEVKDNFFHAPSEMVAELVIEPEAYRKTDAIDVEEQQCDLYTHELVSPVSDALFGVSQPVFQGCRNPIEY